MKKAIITIAGKPGSGKSTTAKLLAEELNFHHYSTGDFFREIGKEMGLDVLATNKAAFHTKEIDAKVDDRQRRLGEIEDRFVIDARLGWYFIPQSFKVYLDLDFLVAAERILKYMEKERLESEQLPNDPVEYATLLEERLKTESERYLGLYGVDPSDPSNYDVVINSAHQTPQQVADSIAQSFKNWLKN